MKNYTRRGTLTALSSIAHGGESRGTTQMFRREAMVMPDGRKERVPIISGNSLRGQLRDHGMLHLCKLLGYGENGKGLSLSAFHFLFSGGALSGDGGKAVDVSLQRELRANIPLVSVFGGGTGNQLIPGRLTCEKGIPVFEWTAHLVPEDHLPERLLALADILSMGDHNMESFTRSDDAKDVRRQHLLGADVRQALEDQEREAAEKHAAGEKKKDHTPGTKQQMRYSIETLAAGVHIYWEVHLKDASEVEFSAFTSAFNEWADYGHIGGKAGTGHGKVRVDMGDWIVKDPRETPEGLAIKPETTAYREFIGERAGRIEELLGDIK